MGRWLVPSRCRVLPRDTTNPTNSKSPSYVTSSILPYIISPLTYWYYTNRLEPPPSTMRFGLSPLHAHWYYVWIPILTAFVWVGTLLAMLITWLAQGRPKYVSMDGNIAYISDIGADILKPLFITGCSITGVGFVLILVVERWLRHRGRYAFGISIDE